MKKKIKYEINIPTIEDVYHENRNKIQSINGAVAKEIIKSEEENSDVSIRLMFYRLHYIDARPLIETVDKSIIKRIETGHFGERNYA